MSQSTISSEIHGKEKIYAMYFSPCGNVKKIVTHIAQTISDDYKIPYTSIDCTMPEERTKDYVFDKNALLIIGFPVYAGRIPNKIMPFVRDHIHGSQCVAIPVVSFGNRNYDNALSELDYLLTENGFLIAGGAAIVSQHSFSSCLAPGRPDQKDMEDLSDFAHKISEKMSCTSDFHAVNLPGENPPEKYYVPLGVDGKPAKFLKAVPILDKTLCTQCGKCASVCPMNSIHPKEAYETTSICIKCHACIHICPTKARCFQDEAFLSHKKMLEKNYSERKESVYFL